MILIPSDARFASWEGGCLFISSRMATRMPFHAHHALQLAFGTEPGIRFRSSEEGTWTAYDGAVVGSGAGHAMDSTMLPACVTLFVEPETRAGRALAERWLCAAGGSRVRGIGALPAAVLDGIGAPLFTVWRDGGDDDALASAGRDVVHALAGEGEPTRVSDPRVLRATAYVGARLHRPISLAEVAAEARLSPGRFRHLFVEQTGMRLRAYVRWRRFMRVWELVAVDTPLAASAHAAGFADAAHLSRTSRAIFGFPPSAIGGVIAANRRPARVRAPSSSALRAVGGPRGTRA